MKVLSYVIAALFLLSIPVSQFGCGADLDNPTVYDDTDDSPEELELLEEVEAELEELEAEEEADNF